MRFIYKLPSMKISLFYTIYRQDLNVSFLKGQKYKLQNSVQKISNEVHVSFDIAKHHNIIGAIHSFEEILFKIESK